MHLTPMIGVSASTVATSKIQRLTDMADDQPKWLFENRELMPFQSFESRFQVQVRYPFIAIGDRSAAGAVYWSRNETLATCF